MAKKEIGITHLTYELPQTCQTLQQLQEEGSLITDIHTLSSFGFGTAYVTKDNEELFQMQVRVLKNLLEYIKNDNALIDSVIVYHGVSLETHNEPDSPLSTFRYSTSRLQFETELHNVTFFTLSQQGCNGLLNAIWLAKRLLENSAKRYVLIVSADRLMSHSPREIIHNIMSDGAGGLVIDKHSPSLQIISHHEVSQPYYWNTPERELEVLSAYFPIAKRVIEETLVQAKLSTNDIRWIVPHNVSVRSWEILAQLIGVPLEKIWLENVEKVGHTVSTDHILNLHNMRTQNVFEPGDHLLMFSFGFGASWAAQILEY
jgi:3-oxoacyl-[acyl-carrier-protein] synthase-3